MNTQRLRLMDAGDRVEKLPANSPPSLSLRLVPGCLAGWLAGPLKLTLPLVVQHTYSGPSVWLDH